jgi:serine/threonine protein kinase
MNTGDRLGRYELGRRLGDGAMSEVFVARHPLLEREVAVKVLKREWRDDQEHFSRFLDDARAAHALNHPNIVRVLDVDDSQAHPFIVMDLVEGEPLDARCDGRVQVLAAARIGRDVAGALAAAHAEGLIHRDVKPSNILIERRTGLAKLTDFGAAKRVRPGASDLSELGRRIGTPRYMAPEQVEGKDVTPRADLFALGATLYELLAGRPAFAGETIGAVFASILVKEPPPLEELRDDVPAPFAELIRRLLAKNPAERPASAEDVSMALDRLAEVVLPIEGLPVETFQPGDAIMAAGATTSRILILKEGAVEISVGGVRLNEIDEPGTIFGELSVLLHRPHTVDVRALRRSTLHVADAGTFFRDNPGITLHVATGLARRLVAADARLLKVREEIEAKAPGSVARVVESIREALRNTVR